MSEQRSDRGSILIFLLASIALLAGAILGLLTVEQGRASRARTEIERTRAFTIAESGIDTVAVLLAANAFPPGSTLDWGSDGVDNDGDGLLDEGDESLTATVDRWELDGLDNDGDGLRDEPDEAIARVACTVPIGTSTVTVTGWLRRQASALPLTPPAALTILDPNAAVRFSGNAFRVGGTDVNLDGTAGPSAPLLGIAIDGTPDQILTQLSSTQFDNVTGAGGWPSIGAWSPGSPDWIANMIEAMRPLANINFTNYPGTYNGNLGDWQTGNYLVTYSNGLLSVGGGSRGAGVLLVEGDLEVSGDWQFAGYVFVSGQLRMSGGGSGTLVRGAIFVGGDVQQTSTMGSLATFVSGSVDLVYSSEALGAVRAALGRFAVVAETEP